MSRPADSQLAAELETAFQRAAGMDAPRRDVPAVSAAEPPRLSVALASYNRRDTLVRALEALATQSYPAERFEVVVVLDGSTDGSAEAVRSIATPYPLKLVEQQNRGLAATRNRGASEATHDVVVFGDDDILLEPDCLAVYAMAHAAMGRDGLVLGTATPVVEGTGVWARWVRDWWERHYERKADRAHRWTFVDVADGMASLPLRAFRESGGFDESFRERRQDWEWGIRLLERGLPMRQLLDARGDHEVDTSMAAAIRYARQEGRSDVQLGTKHPRVRGRLPLARFASRPSRLARLASERPRVAELGADAFRGLALPLARASRSEAALHRVVGLLRTNAYLLGVREALGSEHAVEEFLAPVAAGAYAETITLDLGRPAPLDVAPVGGELELSVVRADRELTRVPAMEPGEQWDWDTLTKRVVRALAER